MTTHNSLCSDVNIFRNIELISFRISYFSFITHKIFLKQPELLHRQATGTCDYPRTNGKTNHSYLTVGQALDHTFILCSSC